MRRLNPGQAPRLRRLSGMTEGKLGLTPIGEKLFVLQGDSDLLARLTPYLSTLGLAALIFYFGYQALTGDRGLLSSEQRGQALVQKSSELTKIRGERVELERRAQLLRDSSLSADLLEERAHSLLGYADPRDYVIRADQ